MKPKQPPQFSQNFHIFVKIEAAVLASKGCVLDFFLLILKICIKMISRHLNKVISFIGVILLLRRQDFGHFWPALPLVDKHRHLTAPFPHEEYFFWNFVFHQTIWPFLEFLFPWIWSNSYGIIGTKSFFYFVF